MYAVAGPLDEDIPDRDASWSEALRAPFDALAAGDAAALGAVWDLASRRLYGLALWRTGREEDARDVVQDVFVRLAPLVASSPPSRNRAFGSSRWLTTPRSTR
jgi:hypothetical protein